ncbi:MAG: outer membrane protein assembly factor BamD [Fibromonadales bacterium]|nr:outer membrane protein assembly factor BamD [Fibromonadales bacterium]
MENKNIKLFSILNSQFSIKHLCLLLFLYLQSCTCCAYFNHAWNMEEAYEQSTALRQARQDSVPGDSVLKDGQERKLYDRVIEKGSRTVERFPKNENQVPKAVFMMAEAFRHKGECRQAVEKYDELERYFPQYDSMPKAEYERAYCYYENGEYALSRFSAEHILEYGEKHEYYLPAMELMSLLQEKEGLPSDAIASLKAVLASGFGTPWTRARARMRLANLYYEQKNYPDAREHYLNKELSVLSIAERYKAQSTAAECLLMMSDTNGQAAAKEYGVLADSVAFKDKRNFSLIRQGEILLNMDDENGVGLLRKVVYSEPKSEMASRAFFGIGDFRQRGRKYPEAILFYDSSFKIKPASYWGRESNSRRNALSKLLSLKDTVATLQKADKPFFPQEFQIAELFLLKLSEIDSALALLAKLDSTLQDSILKARAIYTRAFVYDEFKRDTSKAYPLYRRLIEHFPGLNYAKQAQANMGLQVTVKTKEDLAHDAFLKAEEAWLKAQRIPVEHIKEVDVAYQNAIALYDSVIIGFPKTQPALQAMYAKASILLDDIGNADSARAIFTDLGNNHYQTPWGRAAWNKIRGKLSTNESDLNYLRKGIEQTKISIQEQSERYWREMEKKQKEPPPPPKIAEDEVLLNDYNTLYDFK